MKKISIQNTEPHTLASCQEAFINRCKAKNLARTTITTYRLHCSLFTRYMGDDTLPASRITPVTVDGFIVYLQEKQKCNDVTIQTYMRSIRVYLYHCMDTGAVNPFRINLPKAEKKLKPTYNDTELELLLKKPDMKVCDFTEYKIWVYSSYLLATGNRLSTALNVRICDLDFDNNLVNLQKTKNRTAQIIPMSNMLHEILQEYLSYRKGTPKDFLFCNSVGAKADPHTYQDLLSRYNRMRGVEKTSAHLYRHTFAKKWIMNGGDVFRLQKLLGHSDLAVTREYVNIFGVDLSENYSQFNPLDTMSGAVNARKIRLVD